MELEEFKKKLESKANEINIKIDKKQAQDFYDYMNLLIEWNKNINLTAIIEENEIILKHFIDCFTINNYVKQGDFIMDVGTGAGFPGLPIKILNKNNKVVLIDSLNKRINFLKEVCSKLKLENIESIHGRAEELAYNIHCRETADIVVSRAVARLSVLLEYTLPYVKIGGICVCMKGPNIEEELEDAMKSIRVLGGEISEIKKLNLPGTDIERNIIVIKKVINTPNNFPRKAGIPNKQPIA